jgi:hypothetical protein
MKFSTCLAIVLALVSFQAAQASSRRRLPEDVKGSNSTSRGISVWPYYGNYIPNQHQKELLSPLDFVPKRPLQSSNQFQASNNQCR